VSTLYGREGRRGGGRAPAACEAGLADRDGPTRGRSGLRRWARLARSSMGGRGCAQVETRPTLKSSEVLAHDFRNMANFEVTL
jgi:hypothetical protein